MILGARSSWGHVCQNFLLSQGLLSLLTEMPEFPRQGPGHSFQCNVYLDICSSHLPLKSEFVHLTWMNNLAWSSWLLTISSNQIPDLSPQTCFILSNSNWKLLGPKILKASYMSPSPSHLPGPPAGSASDRHSEPSPLSSPWQPHWSKLLSPSTCKLWSLPVPLCFCPCPSRLLGRARGTPRSACALLCRSVCWLWGRKSWGCLLFLSLLTSLLYVSCAAPCPLPTGLQPLRSAAPQASRPAPCPLGTCLPALLPSDLCSDIILAQRLSLLPSIRYSNTPPTPPNISCSPLHLFFPSRPYRL